jgi:hypothetical protein
MGNNDREHVAELFESAAAEFEKAAQHCRVAAKHFRGGEVPRGCAHGFAAQGHSSNADESMDNAARLHSTRALVE